MISRSIFQFNKNLSFSSFLVLASLVVFQEGRAMDQQGEEQKLPRSRVTLTEQQGSNVPAFSRSIHAPNFGSNQQTGTRRILSHENLILTTLNALAGSKVTENDLVNQYVQPNPQGLELPNSSDTSSTLTTQYEQIFEGSNRPNKQNFESTLQCAVASLDNSVKAVKYYLRAFSILLRMEDPYISKDVHRKRIHQNVVSLIEKTRKNDNYILGSMYYYVNKYLDYNLEGVLEDSIVYGNILLALENNPGGYSIWDISFEKLKSVAEQQDTRAYHKMAKLCLAFDHPTEKLLEMGVNYAKLAHENGKASARDTLKKLSIRLEKEQQHMKIQKQIIELQKHKTEMENQLFETKKLLNLPSQGSSTPTSVPTATTTTTTTRAKL